MLCKSNKPTLVEQGAKPTASETLSRARKRGRSEW
jgi:hypothetical protein